jgi:transposase
LKEINGLFWLDKPVLSECRAHQVHGIDAAEKVVVRRQLRRSQVMKFFEALSPCLIGMEACATAHY